MDSKQLHILRHTLGLNEDGSGKSYRNYFATEIGCSSWPVCMQLVKKGFMVSRNMDGIAGIDYLFQVTPEGRKVVDQYSQNRSKLKESK